MTQSQPETLTFLFTDIEGSTRLWEQEPEAMRAAIDRHNIILRNAISDQDGRVFRTAGDAIYASFHTAPQALTAAANAQRSLYAEEWPTGLPLRVRVVLHTTEAEAELGDYVGAGLNRIGRLLGVCHGGQTLLTQATQQLVRDHLPDGVGLMSLGRHRFRDMIHPERIFQLSIDGLPANFPPLKTAETVTNNLPQQTTQFIGRDDEIAELSRLLNDPATRLITVVGPGGMGKTRLSLATVERYIAAPDISAAGVGKDGVHGQRAMFPDGVFLVSLAPLRSPEHIVTSIAEATGYQLDSDGRQTRTLEEQLLDFLREKELLLILDNFEHLLDGAGLATAILEHAAGVQILATSRERLHLRNEQVFPIDGLEFPDWETPEDAAEYSAVRLFVQSASRVEPSFTLREDDLAPLTRICRLVGGMPLGLELAAGWVDVLPLEEIVAEIQESVDFLETDMQDVPARQRSMRAVFEYSWQRLGEPERVALCQLSVFRGGFERQAAREVAGTSIRTLAALVSKSLLQVHTAHDRYGIHELVRQYAAEELAKNADRETVVRDRHSTHFAAELQRCELELKGSKQLEAVRQIEMELDNIRAAWDWSVQRGQTELLMQSLESLCIYYEWRGRSEEGEAACRAGAEVALSRSESVLTVRSTIWQASFARNLGWREAAYKLLDQCKGYLEGEWVEGRELLEAGILLQLSALAWEREDAVLASSLLEQSLEYLNAADDRWTMARALARLSYIARNSEPSGDADGLVSRLQSARGNSQRSLELSRELGDTVGIAVSLDDLGALAFCLGNLDEAIRSQEESVSLFDKLPMHQGQIRARLNLATCYITMGRFEIARQHARRAMDIGANMGSARITGTTARSLALVYLAQRDYEAFDLLFPASLAAVRKFNDRHELAVSVAVAALADCMRGRQSGITQMLQESLQTAVESKIYASLMFSLPVLAQKLPSMGQAIRAVEIDALGRAFLGALYEDLVVRPYFGDQFAGAFSELPPEDVAAAEERGRHLNLWETVEELLIEMKQWG